MRKTGAGCPRDPRPGGRRTPRTPRWQHVEPIGALRRSGPTCVRPAGALVGGPCAGLAWSVRRSRLGPEVPHALDRLQRGRRSPAFAGTA